MTSGTTVRNGMSWVSTESGNGLQGPLFQRTWSGSDSIPAVDEAPKPAPFPAHLQAFGPGMQRFEAALIEPPFLRRRQRRSRPPKRASLGENPYEASIRDVNFEVYPANNNPQQPPVTNRYGFDCYMIENSNWDSNHDIALLGRLRTKVAGSDFNLGVSLAESREALGTITDAASRLYWSYRAMKRGDIWAAQRTLLNGNDRAAVGWVNKEDGTRKYVFQHTASDNWLALQYAWLPLLADAKAAAEFIAHRHFYPHQQVARASLKIGHPLRWGGSSNALPKSFTGFTQKTIKAILSETPSSVQLSGLTDPLSVAWELVPYSFVADWFVPIGDYLSARGLSGALKGTFVTTTFRINSFNGLSGGVPGEFGPSWAGSPCERVREKLVFNKRTVSSSLDVPLPSFTPLGQSLSWKRAANAASLLISAFR